MTPEWASALANIAQAIAVAVAAGAAVYGVNAWQRELRGRRKLELAEEVLTAFNKARKAIASARHPSSFGDEGSSRPVHESMPEGESTKRYRDSMYVPIARLRQDMELFARLETLRFVFQAYFGENSAAPFNVVAAAPHKIAVASRMLIDTATDNREFGRGTPEEQEKRRAQRREWEATIWAGMATPDTLAEEIDTAVAEIEAICVPILRSRG